MSPSMPLPSSLVSGETEREGWGKGLEVEVDPCPRLERRDLGRTTVHSSAAGILLGVFTLRGRMQTEGGLLRVSEWVMGEIPPLDVG